MPWVEAAKYRAVRCLVAETPALRPSPCPVDRILGGSPLDPAQPPLTKAFFISRRDGDRCAREDAGDGIGDIGRCLRGSEPAHTRRHFFASGSVSQ